MKSTKTISSRTAPKKPASVGTKNINLGTGITILSHESVTASVTAGPLMPQTRDIDNLPTGDNVFKNNPHFQIVNFDKKTGTPDQSIFELTDFQNEADLKTHPLKIKIKPKKNAKEIILPFVFDGKDFLPFGTTKKNEVGEIICSLTNIPEDSDVVKARSLDTAMRLVFIKFANKLGLGGKTEMLRWVDYSGGIGVRTEEGLTEKIKNANKIVLIVHGIIGDTGEMAIPFKSFVDAQICDLVLTFDYENLNTKIEETSAKLLKILQDNGFGENDKKQLVIVAHSMGGLVARYMIEHLGADKFIDKLVMAGTPNGGSKFGDIPTYINWLSTLLGVGTKLFPNALTGIATTFLTLTQKTLFVTLNQMNPDDLFIKNLALSTPPPGVRYHVLGGNLDKFLANDADAKKLMDKALYQTGEWVYKNVTNDIAVSTESIFSVPSVDKKEIACHHLNYFLVNESIAALKAAIN